MALSKIWKTPQWNALLPGSTANWRHCVPKDSQKQKIAFKLHIKRSGWKKMVDPNLKMRWGLWTTASSVWNNLPPDGFNDDFASNSLTGLDSLLAGLWIFAFVELLSVLWCGWSSCNCNSNIWGGIYPPFASVFWSVGSIESCAMLKDF